MGVKDQCIGSVVAVSDDTPESTQSDQILAVPSASGLAILKRMLMQLSDNRGFKEV